MTKEKFEMEVLSLLEVLHSVSYSVLQNHEDQLDAVQECVKKALQKRESLREDRYLKTWLVRILLNECYNIKRHRQRVTPREALRIVAPETADRTLFLALSQLEEPLRLPLVLHHISGYSTREIASILRVPEGTIKGRLVRGRNKLRALLEEEEA